MLQTIHSALDALRSIKRPSHNSTFRTTGELTPEEFVLAGDYLTFKFPTWQWSGGDVSKRRDFLPNDKQFLVTKHVPCLRRLDENFAGGWEGGDEADKEFEEGDGGGSGKEKVQSMDDKGVVEEVSELESEDEIPDMEDDDDDEAIIRDPKRGGATSIAASGRSASGRGTTAPRRTYNLYIIYHPYYRTPCLYLSGYDGSTQLPLTPNQMMEDIMGDYKDKTVTVENFPHLEGNVQMVSVHPCRHAGVMRGLLDRADAALKLRRKKQLAAAAKEADHHHHHQSDDVPDIGNLSLDDDTTPPPPSPPPAPVVVGGGKPLGTAADEWEEIVAEDGQDRDEGIRVDQYLVVFLKFMASVTPGIEHDFTMGL